MKVRMSFPLQGYRSFFNYRSFEIDRAEEVGLDLDCVWSAAVGVDVAGCCADVVLCGGGEVCQCGLGCFDFDELLGVYSFCFLGIGF